MVFGPHFEKVNSMDEIKSTARLLWDLIDSAEIPEANSFWTSQSVRSEWWPSAKDGQTSFGSVADLTMRRLYMEDVSNKAPRLSLHSSATDQPRERPESVVHDAQCSENLDQLRPTAADAVWQNLGLNVEENPDQFMWPRTEAGFDPEIEMFLADFNRSEFTWNFPLNGNQDFDPFWTSQYPGF
ncbi:hypothetical protein ACHAPU_010424 [Fusarium lateritium]